MSSESVAPHQTTETSNPAVERPPVTPHPDYGTITTDDESCFLCGTRPESITDEHVFPKWLQSRYDLWNSKIDLLNKTSITYKQLKIPCCPTCNGGALSKLESIISQAVTGGYHASRSLDPHLWYLWAGKLYFGILRKELNLRRERSDPSAGSIVREEGLKSFRSLHLFLQGIRGKHEFVGEPPYSVLVCNLHDLGSSRSYSFRDSLAYMTLSIRMGDVGVIVSFEDDGLTTSSYGRYLDEVNHNKLHPVQFDELYARTTYQLSLIESSINYLTEFAVDGSRGARTSVSGGLYLRERSNKELAEVLRAHLSQWVKRPKEGEGEWHVSPGLVPTWMTGENGELLLKSLPEWEAEAKLGA